MKIAKVLIVASAAAAVSAEVTQAAPSSLKHAAARIEPLSQELQARGGASLLDDATSLASTSNEHTLNWRIFFSDPSFKPDLRELLSFREAYDTVQRTKPDGNVLGRADLSGLSLVERGKYGKAVALLNYYATADTMNARRLVQYNLRKKPRRSRTSLSWIADLPREVQHRIVQREKGSLDLRGLSAEDRSIVRKFRMRSYRRENHTTLRQSRKQRSKKANFAQSTPSAGVMPARSVSELSASNVPVPGTPQEGLFDVFARPEYPTKLARNSSPRGRTSRESTPDIPHHAAHSDSLTDPLSAPPALPPTTRSDLSSPANAVAAALKSLRDSSPTRTLKRLRSFDLNEPLTGLDD